MTMPPVAGIDGSAAPAFDGEAKAALLMRLRAAGVRDLSVLRAMETVPRTAFARAGQAGFAVREMSLPIGCGQTMPEPVFVARILEALACAPGSRVLVVGAGSGYSSALLARLAGEVLAFERYQGLVTDARARLAALGIENVALEWGDGLAAPFSGLFDRIVVNAVLDEPPTALLASLAPAGVLIYPVYDAPEGGRSRPQRLMRAMRGPLGTDSHALPFGCRLQPAQSGRSDVL